ncbi:hypothetical protein, partial [Halorubrum sp. Atlit-26R]|uniref:hypothetical protein n=1 Tax=Halorubrum sp. Atlit-26R TaxID=2282128 RepID=UPI001313E0B6
TDTGDNNTDPTTPEEEGNATESENGGSDTNSDAQNTDEQPYEYVFPSDNLRLVESRWDGKTYIAEFEAVNRPERITVTDGGRESDENENVEVDRESYTISTDGTTEIRFTVVEDRQVTIDDGDLLLLKGYSSDIFSLPTANALATLFIGLLTGFLATVAQKLMRDHRETSGGWRVF